MAAGARDDAGRDTPLANWSSAERLGVAAACMPLRPDFDDFCSGKAGGQADQAAGQHVGGVVNVAVQAREPHKNGHNQGNNGQSLRRTGVAHEQEGTSAGEGRRGVPRGKRRAVRSGDEHDDLGIHVAGPRAHEQGLDGEVGDQGAQGDGHEHGHPQLAGARDAAQHQTGEDEQGTGIPQAGEGRHQRVEPPRVDGLDGIENGKFVHKIPGRRDSPVAPHSFRLPPYRKAPIGATLGKGRLPATLVAKARASR